MIRKCLMCREEKTHMARGLCGNCYRKATLAGNLDYYPVVRPNKEKEFTCEKCGAEGYSKHRAFGLCSKCYYLRYEKPAKEAEKAKNVTENTKNVTVASCLRCKEEKVIKGQGLCDSCLESVRRTGNLDDYERAHCNNPRDHTLFLYLKDLWTRKAWPLEDEESPEEEVFEMEDAGSEYQEDFEVKEAVCG